MYQFHTNHPTPNVYLDIARGAISNSKIVHKFGANFDIDQGTDPRAYGLAAAFTLGRHFPAPKLFTAFLLTQATRLP